MLPPAGVPWPPPELKPALERMRTWDAWWSGDVDELTSAYAGPRSGAPVHAAQYAGGILGVAARTWWGRPPTAGEPQTKLHIPLASDIARASADLLFAEPITVTADSPETSAAFDEFLGDGPAGRLLEGAETGAALGGYYLRVAHNAEHFDDAWVDVIAPDAAHPEWVGGRMVAVTLWWVLTEDRNVVWRHLERHERGRNFHGLYRGAGDELGIPMPLADHPVTAPYGEIVDADGGVETGHPDGLDIVYIANMRPQRRWRRTPALAPMGRSDFDGVEPIFDALDECWSSWMRDLRLAKARIVVPEHYLDAGGGPGKPVTFDPDREVYSSLPGVMPQEGSITLAQFAIRVEEHERTATGLIAQGLRTAGYSVQTLGEQGDAAVTATEVVTRERRSFITRDRKITYHRPELVDLFTAWLAIRAHVFGHPALDPTGMAITFADSVSEDQLTLANTAAQLAGAKAASIETRVRLIHPDWDDDRVAAEVEAIREDDKPAVTGIDPFVPNPADYADGDPPDDGEVPADEGAPAEDTGGGAPPFPPRRKRR